MDDAIKKAMATGEVIEIRYLAGSSPGIPRRIIPIAADHVRLRALCLQSNTEKTFLLSKIMPVAPATTPRVESDLVVTQRFRKVELTSTHSSEIRHLVDADVTVDELVPHLVLAQARSTTLDLLLRLDHEDPIDPEIYEVELDFFDWLTEARDIFGKPHLIDAELVTRYGGSHFLRNVELCGPAEQYVDREVHFISKSHPDRWRFEALASTGVATRGKAIPFEERIEVLKAKPLCTLAKGRGSNANKRDDAIRFLVGDKVFRSIFDANSENYFTLEPCTFRMTDFEADYMRWQLLAAILKHSDLISP